MIGSLALGAVEISAGAEMLVVRSLICTLMPCERCLALGIGNASLHSFLRHLTLILVDLGAVERVVLASAVATYEPGRSGLLSILTLVTSFSFDVSVARLILLA
jgi:hypothetical protein